MPVKPLILFASFGVLLIAGCGGSDETPNSSSAPQTPPQTESTVTENTEAETVASETGSEETATSETDETETVAEDAEPVQTAATQPADPGQILFKRCRTCHTLEEDGRHKVGPNLWGVAGSDAGTKEGFKYSEAMKNSGLTWTDENLDGYIERPSKFIPRNRMSFVGIRDAEDRALLIEYIKANTGAAEE